MSTGSHAKLALLVQFCFFSVWSGGAGWELYSFSLTKFEFIHRIAFVRCLLWLMLMLTCMNRLFVAVCVCLVSLYKCCKKLLFSGLISTLLNFISTLNLPFFYPNPAYTTEPSRKIQLLERALFTSLTLLTIMACYSNPDVEALRWQLARFFPRLDVKPDTNRMPISDNPRAAATAPDRKSKHDALRTGSTSSLNLQTSMWNTYQAAYTSTNQNGRDRHGSKHHHTARHVPAKDTPKGRRLRQLYIEYKTVIAQSGRTDASHDPIMTKVLHHARDDPDKAIEILQQALAGSRLVEILAYSRRLGQWRRAWQEMRRQRLHNMLSRTAAPERPVAASKEATGPPSQALVLPPLPPPLPPCLQCVLAKTCCSLTTTPYAQAFANDRTGAGDPGKRLSLLDEYAILVADHQSSEGPKTAATLAQKKRELDRKLLLRALAADDCESPFLAEPPVQCTRCYRLGERGCLQQSKDLTGTADVLDLDDNGSYNAVWFASSGPPPESLLRQHCQSLLSKMRGLAAPDAAGDKGQRKRPRLEAVFCRDSSAMSAIKVAAKAEALLGSIFRQRQTAEGVGQVGIRTPGPRIRGLSQYADSLHPNDATISRQPPFRVPQGKRPVQAAAPLEVTLRLPKWSLLDVHAGRGVATAALAYGCGSGDGQGDARVGDSFAPAPLVLPGWLPRVQQGESKPLYGWHDYFLDVGEDRAAREFQKQQNKEESVKKKARKTAKGKGSSTKRHRKHVAEQVPLVDASYDDVGDDREEGLGLEEEVAECAGSQAPNSRNQRSWRDEMFRIRMDEYRARLDDRKSRPSAPESSRKDDDDAAGPLSWEQLVALAGKFGVRPEQLERFKQRRQTDPGLAALCRKIAKSIKALEG